MVLATYSCLCSGITSDRVQRPHLYFQGLILVKLYEQQVPYIVQNLSSFCSRVLHWQMVGIVEEQRKSSGGVREKDKEKHQ